MVRTIFRIFFTFLLGDGNKKAILGFFQKNFIKMFVILKMDILKMSNFKKFMNS